MVSSEGTELIETVRKFNTENYEWKMLKEKFKAVET